MRIRLADDDRERLGLEQEWIDAIDVARIMTTDGDLLDDHGYPGGAEQFLEELVGTPLMRDGEPVMVPVLDDDDQPVVENGKPKLRKRMTRPLRVRRALVWLAVRRAGVAVPWEGFEFGLTGIEYDNSGDPPSGKAPTAAAASAKTASATRSRSRKSSASSRGRSTS